MAGPDLKPFRMEWLDGRRGNFYAIITPTVAVDLLARNTHNRAKKQLRIDAYAKAMLAGRWNPDSSDIKFDVNGVLIDGQNRLVACIQADVPFPTLVRTGLDPESFKNVDTGAGRSIGDVFRIAGVSDYHNVAAAVSLRARYEALVNAGQTILEKRLPLDRDEATAYLAEHPMVQEMSLPGMALYRIAPGIQRSVWIAGLSMFAEVDEAETRRLAGQFIAGEPVPQLVSLMRYAMATQTPKQQERAVKLKNAGLRHLTAFVMTWNAVRKNEDLPRITIHDDEHAVAVI
jgi:hypothetical protein